MIANNYINWDTGGGGYAGIYGSPNITDVVIKNNVFCENTTCTAAGYAVQIASGDRNVITGNQYLAARTTGTHPFYNQGTNPSSGTVSPTASQSSITVSNTLVNDTSLIRIQQEAGTPLAYTISTSTGVSFTLTFASSTVGNEVYRYEIVQ